MFRSSHKVTRHPLFIDFRARCAGKTASPFPIHPSGEQETADHEERALDPVESTPPQTYDPFAEVIFASFRTSRLDTKHKSAKKAWPQSISPAYFETLQAPPEVHDLKRDSFNARIVPQTTPPGPNF